MLDISKFIGVIIAFLLGYITASNEWFLYLTEEKSVLYSMLGILLSYLAIFIPLERIAQAETDLHPPSLYRSSAREHLQRRGSF